MNPDTPWREVALAWLAAFGVCATLALLSYVVGLLS